MKNGKSFLLLLLICTLLTFSACSTNDNVVPDVPDVDITDDGDRDWNDGVNNNGGNNGGNANNGVNGGANDPRTTTNGGIAD